MDKGITKLFKVTLKGLTFSPTGTPKGVSYVVAKDPTEAYNKVRKVLDEKDYGFSKDRELDKIELIAEDYWFTNVHHVLYI